MRLETLFAGLLAIMFLPGLASAEVKSYTIDLYRILNTTTLTVTGASHCSVGCANPRFRIGDIEINDESNAHPTLDLFQFLTERTGTTRTDVFAGVNSFIHVRTLSTTLTLPGQTGTGDSEGFVKWNPLSSWTPLGGRNCKGSNEIGNPLGLQICPVVGFIHEMTQTATVPSQTYDFPLWTFDAEGDISSDSYLWQINSNRSSNEEYFIHAKLNIDIPAMSMVGFGLLGVSLVFLGLRTMRLRRK